MTPDEYIQSILKGNTPMQSGKFLVKEVCDDVGFTIEHLKQLESTFRNMDEKHKYEEVIFDSYIENNDFSLTGEQRLKAYAIYKKSKE